MLNDFYYQMVLIRKFEERMLDLFSKGELFGTTHAYIGQEAGAVAVMNNLAKQDIVFSNHRCHGHYLARTGDVEGLMAELMGKEGGICGGRGGSQHLCKDNFYTNGVQGSIVPVAAGMAYAEKIKKTDAITALSGRYPS
jgi:TPP-dependent pyruvate/acetoin dehydrogenase alpha subunit